MSKCYNLNNNHSFLQIIENVIFMLKTWALKFARLGTNPLIKNYDSNYNKNMPL
jgi:hypothetical protein